MLDKRNRWEAKINNGLDKLYKIKEMVDELIGIPNSDKYSINKLRELYYEKNPDVFDNLINAYNHVNKYTDERIVEDSYSEFLSDLTSVDGHTKENYIYYKEDSGEDKYKLVNIILEDFSRGIDSGANHTRKGEKAKEEDIYLLLDFEQYVGADIISIKNIKQNWNRYSEQEKTKIQEIAKKKFDTRVWVLKEAVDKAIEFSEKEKSRYERNNKEKNKQEKTGEDIDI